MVKQSIETPNNLHCREAGHYRIDELQVTQAAGGQGNISNFTRAPQSSEGNLNRE